MKWAEEGYTVIEITEAAFGELPDALDMACRELGQSPSAEPKNVIGLVGEILTHCFHSALLPELNLFP